MRNRKKFSESFQSPDTFFRVMMKENHRSFLVQQLVVRKEMSKLCNLFFCIIIKIIYDQSIFHSFISIFYNSQTGLWQLLKDQNPQKLQNPFVEGLVRCPEAGRYHQVQMKQALTLDKDGFPDLCSAFSDAK